MQSSPLSAVRAGSVRYITAFGNAVLEIIPAALCIGPIFGAQILVNFALSGIMPGPSFNITEVFHIVSNGPGAHLAEASWQTPQAPYLCLDRSSGWTAAPDRRVRWPSRLVATAAENRQPDPLLGEP